MILVNVFGIRACIRILNIIYFSPKCLNFFEVLLLLNMLDQFFVFIEARTTFKQHLTFHSITVH